MLVLSRRLNEKIVFPGIHATVQVVGLRAGVVRLGVEAPPSITVLRQELHDRDVEWSRDATPTRDVAATAAADVGPMLGNRLSIAARGLAELDGQLRQGRVAEARETLAEVREDLELLRARLAKESGEEFPRRAGRPCRALLVEDDRNERELLASFLRMAGVDVDTAGDGSDALDYLRARARPDVVLLDMGLPRCDGPTALREMRKDPALAGLKVFAVSGHTPDELGIRPEAQGIDRWFQKPLNPAELLHDLQLDDSVWSHRP